MTSVVVVAARLAAVVAALGFVAAAVVPFPINAIIYHYFCQI